jgi:ABC-type transport system substrate-binding protein
VDSKKNPTPILCGRYHVSANQRNWFIYLDENATFSDGSFVRVEDVVASYNQAMQNDYYKNRFLMHLISVEPTEDGGIQFALDTPMDNLPILLDVPIVKARDVADSGLKGEEIPLGTGPYVFAESAGGDALVRNENWWCGNTKSLQQIKSSIWSMSVPLRRCAMPSSSAERNRSAWSAPTP